MSRRRAVAVAAGLCGSAAIGAVAAPAFAATPPIRHVFVIVLENESAATTFGPSSPATYLAKTLRSEGAYLPNYYGIGHQSNDNYIAMISGQAPNVQNQADCQQFDDLLPGTIGIPGTPGSAYGQAQGSGCIYPSPVQTIASQLTARGFSWRDYNESMGADPMREPGVCGHPGVNGSDGTQKASATDDYATRHDPFVYFHSIIDDTTLCDTHVVNLDQLPQDLSRAPGTANYTFITPGLCNDGHDAPCANGAPGGLAQADKFLRTWVPQITASPAFGQGGLLIITFDEAPFSDVKACCGEIAGPGSPQPGATGPGGGAVGAVLLSPCIAPGTVSQTPYNHYTMLGSVESIFGLAHLGYAGLPGETYFGSDVYTRSCAPGGPGPVGSPPVASIHAPPIASLASSSARIRVRWSAASADSPVVSFTVQARDLSVAHGRRRTVAASTRKTSRTFLGALGHTYEFRVRAANAAGKVSGWAAVTSIIPSRAHIRRGHFSAHWKLVGRRGAWQNHAIQTATPGAGFRLRYVGGALSLIGERTARGGVARVTIDGHTSTLRLRARGLQRRRVIYTAKVKPGVHHLRIVVARGLVALEGFAIASRTS